MILPVLLLGARAARRLCLVGNTKPKLLFGSLYFNQDNEVTNGLTTEEIGAAPTAARTRLLIVIRIT